MTTKKKAKRYSQKAIAAWRKMLFHKLSMWDACRELELALKRDCDSGADAFDTVASGFGDAADAMRADNESLDYYVQRCCGEEGGDDYC